MKTVQLKEEAFAALLILAENNGVKPGEFIDALLNYAWSQERRPGSWEATVPFDPRNYFRREGDDLSGGADRWWP
jgi:hypothetical protein